MKSWKTPLPILEAGMCLCNHISIHMYLKSRSARVVHPQQRRKKRTPPPPKENLLENFSGPKENFPGRWWIQKPYKNQENHIHHRNLSSVDPIFFCKEKFCTGAGRCMLYFSQLKLDMITSLVALQTQTQDRSVLAAQFPKSQTCPRW